MASYFITGSGTDIGKTHILTSMCRNLIQKRKKVMALKPLISGWNEKDNDVIRILHSLSLPITLENINLISFKRLNLPLAPNMAAAREGVKLNFADIYNFCTFQINKYDYLFIEGAGGVMSPLTDNTTYRDLIERLKIPVIFIAGIYLGAISHILTALEALKKCEVKAIILNQHNAQDNLNVSELRDCIQNFTNVLVTTYDTITWDTFFDL